MKRQKRPGTFFEKLRRKGMTAPFIAVSLPIFVGMTAFTADMAVLTAARSQMSTAADAAALAGAAKLYSNNRLKASPNLSNEITAAHAAAKSVAQSNSVMGQNPVIVSNTDNTATGDIVVGYLDPTSSTSALTNSTSETNTYNSVQVTIKRDATHGGLVPTFFSKQNGFGGSTMSVSSSATILNYQVKGFDSAASISANLLPITLDETTYNAMVAGTTTDQYTYTPGISCPVGSGSDGITESKLYPVSNGSPGNWGTVKIGVSNNSTSTLGAQIRSGVTAAQLGTYPGGKLEFSTTTTPPSLTLGGNPGISAGIKDDLEAIIGDPRWIPVYSSVSGNGNNTAYTIVKFGCVRIMDVKFTGNPKYVIVQPAYDTWNPTIVTGSPQPSWRSGGVIRLRLTR